MTCERGLSAQIDDWILLDAWTHHGPETDQEDDEDAWKWVCNHVLYDIILDVSDLLSNDAIRLES